ncbi:MAG TPA: TA system VapC family ribonuclease toxin [Polyangiaceae bacterium]
MIAVDTNVLVHAHREDSEWHAPAAAAVERLAEGVRAWAIPWPCLHEFLAIVTHPRIFRPPSTLPQALEQVRAWLESPSLVLLSESGAHLDTLESMLTASRSVGPRVHDARVAALCMEHAVDTLWSADRDFARFPDLSVENPLVQPR